MERGVSKTGDVGYIVIGFNLIDFNIRRVFDRKFAMLLLSTAA